MLRTEQELVEAAASSFLHRRPKAHAQPSVSWRKFGSRSFRGAGLEDPSPGLGIGVADVHSVQGAGRFFAPILFRHTAS